MARVEFLNGGTKLGEDTSEPYTSQWNVGGSGTLTLASGDAARRGRATGCVAPFRWPGPGARPARAPSPVFPCLLQKRSQDVSIT